MIVSSFLIVILKFYPKILEERVDDREEIHQYLQLKILSVNNFTNVILIRRGEEVLKEELLKSAFFSPSIIPIAIGTGRLEK